MQEGWRETFDAPPWRAPFEVLEGTLEVGRELGEGVLQFTDELLIGGEPQEGADETRREVDEARREIREADGWNKVGEVAEGGLEVGGQVVEGVAEVLTFGPFSD